MARLNGNLDIVVRKMEAIFDLRDEERTALLALPIQINDIKARQDLVRFGDRPSRTFVLLEGFVCRYLMVGAGERQIMSFHIPGETPDFQSLYLRTMDHSLATITDCKLAWVTHEALHALIEAHPRLLRGFVREALIDAAIFREWMAGIGRRDATTRVAHLMCEMFERLRAVGLTTDNSCPFPITQGQLADALGLSNVHVNRTLQELRGKRLIALTRATLTIKDWDGLKEIGDFDATYLHQDIAQAA
jgi:CRP-like cAMP-binding protein